MSMMIGTVDAILMGTLIGLAFGTGLFLLVAMNPWSRPRAVESRIAPYVRRGEISKLFAPKEGSWANHSFVQRILAPTLRRGHELFIRIAGNHDEIAQRLRKAGLSISVSGYRMEQAVWAGIAFAVASCAGAALATTQKVSVGALIVGVLLISLVGLLARDYQLSQQVRKRAERLAREFPSIADLLALAVAAGESPVAAMERVATSSRGALASELSITVGEIHSGVAVEDALIALGTRTPLPSLSRFTEAVAVALERGTPLAEVLRAQAQDARDQSTRDLMEAAGKREISMLIPVIFFLMPLVIVFAIFPGLSVLRIGIQ